jgi:hypothetical protein
MRGFYGVVVIGVTFRNRGKSRCKLRYRDLNTRLCTHILSDLNNLCGQGTMHQRHTATHLTREEVVGIHRLAARSALSTRILTARGTWEVKAKPQRSTHLKLLIV